jgi:peroxiredoxin Q/BCP
MARRIGPAAGAGNGRRFRLASARRRRHTRQGKRPAGPPGDKGDEAMSVETGEPVPDFTLPRDGGGQLGPADFKGKKLVLYFYPKDDTSGCTTEALAFTAKLAEFEAADTAVLGISKDSVKSHDKFREKHALGIPLLSDESGEVVEQFGAWVEKSMYGKKYMGIDRSTFLIDGAGVIQRVWRKVKVPGHVDEVLAAAKEL